MIKLIALLIVFFFAFTVGFAQDRVTVIAIKANMRGTPDSKGVIVNTINQGETYESITQKGAWFLVQSLTHVGWVHGSSLRLEPEVQPSTSVYVPSQVVQPKYPEKPVPRTTVIIEDDGTGPFKGEYVGGNTCSIEIKNDSNKDLTLVFGGVKYSIGAFSSRTIVVDPGTYDFVAEAPGVRSLVGAQGFRLGYSYKWSFYIVTRRI